jgi:hypothetical protein
MAKIDLSGYKPSPDYYLRYFSGSGLQPQHFEFAATNRSHIPLTCAFNIIRLILSLKNMRCLPRATLLRSDGHRPVPKPGTKITHDLVPYVKSVNPYRLGGPIFFIRTGLKFNPAE